MCLAKLAQIYVIKLVDCNSKQCPIVSNGKHKFGLSISLKDFVREKKSATEKKKEQQKI
jgi:hypothetical protein